MRRFNKLLFASMLALLLIATLSTAAFAGSITPAEVVEDLAPGESMTVKKTVTTPEIPPKPDVYFLADTTASMGSVIATVKDSADAILDEISLQQPDAQFGVGNYKDFPYDSYAYQNQLSMTPDATAASTAINAWSAEGGYDGPEGQFYALTQIATDPGIGWRTDSTRIVVWFGDAPAHDPIPIAATGLGYDITEATVIEALTAAGIQVIAISTSTGYLDSLDDNPLLYGGDYTSTYGIVEGGTPGQATRITDATGGVHLTGVNPDEIAEAILDGLSNLPITVIPTIPAPNADLVIAFDPAFVTVISGEDAVFEETITATLAAPQCHILEVIVVFVDDNGNSLGKQLVSIHVKDVTAPKVWCEEAVNPHGENIPGEKRSNNAKTKAKNQDGFYQLFAEDNCYLEPEIYVGTTDQPMLLGSFKSGVVIKFTEAPGADPSCKKIGSSNGQAGAVAWHITLPCDPVVTAVDASGNISTCAGCLVPPSPK